MTATLTGLRAGRWHAVTSLTSASFSVRHAFGVAPVTGTVPVIDAGVEVEASGSPGAVSATLALTGIDTGNQRRDRDLQKPHLLGTAAAPRLTFHGRVVDGPDGWQVTGRLTARASTEVVLSPVELEERPDGSVRVQAAATLDRRALGVRAPRFVIGRRVIVRVDVVLVGP